MSEAIAELYSAIEKAKGLIPRGGSSALKRRIHAAGENSQHAYSVGDRMGNREIMGRAMGRMQRLQSALVYSSSRRKGNSVGLDYFGSKHKTKRTGKYK